MNLKTKLARYIQIEKECRRLQQERIDLMEAIVAEIRSTSTQSEGLMSELGLGCAQVEYEGDRYLVVAGTPDGIEVSPLPVIQ